MRRGLLTLSVALLLATPVLPAAGEGAGLETDEEKTLYAMGLFLAQRLKNLEITQEELLLIQDGLADGILGREPKADLEAYGPKINDLVKQRGTASVSREKKAGTAFREKAAQVEGAVQTESGLVYLELEPGSGAQPGPADTVRLHYKGTLRDGTVFDNSADRGAPATFQLGKVVACFREGLTRMQVGGRSRLVCPPAIAYGDRGYPPSIPPGATLTFEVELLEVVSTGAGSPPAP
jgi:FKBP-type peptidyl-prolyl cis-trans isomerase FkpA/FKBP-type peptidyl-prolyl cis-trans isomerase FklB